MTIDPVCKMTVEEGKAIKAECAGETYYFCSEGCRDKFLENKVRGAPGNMYDLIIVGGGPAGLTAAVYASQLKIHAFLIAQELGGQAIDSTKIENYMGYDFITGPELIKKFQTQLIHSHFIDHLMAEVEKITPVKNGFEVMTSKSNKYFASALIIATGMTRRKLNVDGEERFQRKGIFYGNIQDFSFVQGENVAIIGGGNSALQMVEQFHTIAKDIYLISDVKLTADPVGVGKTEKFKNLKRYEGYKVIGFVGDRTLSSIGIKKMGDEKIINIPVKAAFISIGFRPNSFTVSGLVRLNKLKEIVINSECATSYQGIFAAGDVTNVFGKRIIIASGEGAKAALAARQYILNIRREDV